MTPAKPTSLIGLIDWERFGDRLSQAVVSTNKSLREPSREMEIVNFATLSRACNGCRLSAEAYLWLSAYFAIDPYWAFVSGGAGV